MEPPQEMAVKLLVRIMNENDLLEVSDTRCTVCMGLFRLLEEVIFTECQHVYHRKCVDRWFNEVP